MTSIGRVQENLEISGEELRAYGSEVESFPKNEFAMFFGVNPKKLKKAGKEKPTYLSKQEWEESDYHRDGIEYDESMTPVSRPDYGRELRQAPQA